MARAALDLIVNLHDNASSALDRLSSTLGTVSKLATGLAVGGIAAVGGGLVAAATQGLAFNSTMETVTAQLNAFTKDGNKSAAILDMIRERAARTPFAFEEMARATAGLLPAANQAGTSLESLVEQAEILAASNPAEGLEGAAFALREAVSGDFTSIIERFNLPRQYINQLKEEGVPNLEIVQRAMQQMGYDTDLVANLAQTASGRWSTFKDTLQGIAATATAGVFTTFSSSLGDVNGWLERMQPTLEAVAQRIGQDLAGALQTAIGWAQSIAENWSTWQPILIGIAATIATLMVPALWATATAIGANVAAMAPFLAIAAAIGAAVAVLYVAWRDNWGGIQEKTAAVVDWLKATVWSWFQGTAFPWLQDTALPALQHAFAVAWGAIAAAVDVAYQFLLTTVWPWLRDTAFPWLQDIALPALQSAFQTVWPIIQGAVSTVYTFLRDTVWAWLRNTAWPWLKDTALPALQEAFATAWEAITLAVNSAYAVFRDTIWPWLQTAFSNAAAWVERMKDRWNTAIDTAKDIVQGLQDKITTARDTMQTAIDTIKGLFTTGWDTVKTTVQGIWDTIGGYIEDPINTAKRTVETVIGTIKRLVQGGIDRVNDLITAINRIPVVPDIPTIPGFAAGVRNFSGGLALVGEQGPELVHLPRGSSVYSTPDTRRLLGGDTYYITINAPSGEASAIRREVERVLDARGRRADANLRAGRYR